MSHIVEDGTGLSTANSLLSAADADLINLDYENSSDWTTASTAEKEQALRLATRYLDYHYTWLDYKTYSTQALQWPRLEMYDEDGNSIANNIIPERVKRACAYLALKVIEGNTLLEDFDTESKVKKTKDVIGPITEEREYVHGEDPDKTYQIADRLVAPFIIGDGYTETDVERA